MQNIPVKQTTDLLTADEFNKGIGQELNNSVLSSGQSQSTADEKQMSKAMAIYGTVGDFYTDTGSADAYVLGPIGLRQVPLTLLDGQLARFTATNTNTGASTLDLNGIGVKPITDGGVTLTGGEIVSGEIIETVYVLSADEFRLAGGGGIIPLIAISFVSNENGTIDASLIVQSGREARWKMPDGTEQAGPNMSFAGDGTPQTFTAWVPGGLAGTLTCSSQFVIQIQNPLESGLTAVDCNGNSALALTDAFAVNTPRLSVFLANNTAAALTDQFAANAPMLDSFEVANTAATLTDLFAANASGLTNFDASNTPSTFSDQFAVDAPGLLIIRVNGTTATFTDQFAVDAPGLAVFQANNTAAALTDQFAVDASGLTNFDASNTPSTFTDQFAVDASGLLRFRVSGATATLTDQFAVDASGLDTFEANGTDCSGITGAFVTSASGIIELRLANAQILQPEIDGILAQLDTNALSGGTVDLSGASNGVPSAAGLTSAANLVVKGWTVITN